jgi:hypothetical protein
MAFYQKYFDNTENQNFSTDISIYFKIDKKHLTADQQTALAPFDKMNILAFKLNEKTKNCTR